MTDNNNIRISIIIPTLNEAEYLDSILKSIFNLIDPDQIEVLISDGGSQDSSLEIATRYPCLIVTGSASRARQMNRAAAQAKGVWLLFLHADSQLPTHWQQCILKSHQWGFFPLRLSGKHWALNIIERAICLRSSITQIATGDQGLFFRQTIFNQINGFDDIPIMEDIAISHKARKVSAPDIAAHGIVTSSRRWEKNGIIKTVLLMWGLRLAFWLGVSPVQLHRLYYPDHNQA